MRYAPPGFCLNDFEIVNLDGLYHLIHIQGSPIIPFDATYLESSYGHAVSTDLINWNVKAPVFGIASSPSFDDSGLWNMCIVQYHDKHWMFYTGLNHRKYFQQQIGLAYLHTYKNDNMIWRRYQKNSIGSADATFYQTEGKMAWRDPYVIYDSSQNKWLMYLSAKTIDGKVGKKGCIALCTSDDFFHWDIHEPLIAPQKYREMECPVICQINNNWYMFVSISDTYQVYCFKSDKPTGSFKEIGKVTDPFNYAPRILKMNPLKNELLFIHTSWRKFKNVDTGEMMRGVISEPKLLKFDNGFPYLEWYPKIQYYFRETKKNVLRNFIMLISIKIKYKKLEIGLRCLNVNNGVVLNFHNNRLDLFYKDQIKYFERKLLQTITFNNIKIFFFKEFLDIYGNDRLILSTILYRFRNEGYQYVKLDNKKINFKIYDLKTDLFPQSDDINGILS